MDLAVGEHRDFRERDGHADGAGALRAIPCGVCVIAPANSVMP